MTSNEIPESIIEDGDILPETFTHQNLATEVAEKQSSLAFFVRSDNNNNNILSQKWQQQQQDNDI